MPQSRKQTAYRKSRKFGDVYGGRSRPKITDGIFRRCHSLERPDPLDDLPILMQDNPSRDYYFPISAEEARTALEALPKRASKGITHIWLRRPSKRKIEASQAPLAEFVCGSGVRVVVLYPWKKDGRILLGRNKPKGGLARDYQKYQATFHKVRGWWYAQIGSDNLRRFYIEYLLFHEVGHHVDWFVRHWSKANVAKTEEAADQYAISWSRTTKHVLNRLDALSDESTDKGSA